MMTMRITTKTGRKPVHAGQGAIFEVFSRNTPLRSPDRVAEANENYLESKRAMIRDRFEGRDQG